MPGAPVSTPVSRASIRNAGLALIVLTTVVVGTRVVLAVMHQNRFLPEDGWLVACYVFFMVLAVLYLFIVPAFFRLTDMASGIIEPYETATEDALFIQKGLFTVSACLWFCLWSAKFSLLCLYKKLLDKLPYYTKLWWALVVFCGLTLVGTVISLFLACSSMHAWFSVGACTTPRDVEAAAVSMWFAYAVDVLTDLLIMMLPLRLIITLQMPLSRKISIAGLFCLGWVCIAASTVRVTQIGNNGAQPTVPWLALWGTIEAAIAVIIVTGPGLYRAVKIYSTSRQKYYIDKSNSKANYARSNSRTTEDQDVQLRPFPRTTVSRAEPSSSQEELMYPGKLDGIMVTKAVVVNSSKSQNATK
ncbi:hypothetical protein CORC01_13363 [Colletotrichum orchidophilum]|uniref:Rhodopsin domain-containing protein n=1 Tax=Colletotrichum orchidophilum TaxID=1209926 RepID=A0A1G4AQ90_9PEZI|nr:uncharacterized protein CORC01_13363 [Colletotrichum orchidophilum]OHE91334.1 hypothetical protein CORC01_13363 [Colletotrichum orchidophilum]